jgi:hypothetical protein
MTDVQAIPAEAWFDAKSRPEGAACNIDPTADRLAQEQGNKGEQSCQ